MRKVSKILYLIIIFNIARPNNKVLIMTHHYKRADFIELQYKTLKHFLHDPYEFVVFNDATNKKMEEEINQVCKKFNIRCVRIPQTIHNKPYLKRMPGENYNHPCIRCANVVQYSLDQIGFQYNGIVAIIDSDMFLVKKFSIKEYLKGYDIAALPQERNNIIYFWNGIVFFNMKTLPNKTQFNFNCGTINGIGLDVGGYLYYYLKNNLHLRKKFIDVLHITGDPNENKKSPFSLDALLVNTLPNDKSQLQNLGYNQNEMNFIQSNPDRMEFLCNHTFLHYGAGQNWNVKSQEYHAYKMTLLRKFINSTIKACPKTPDTLKNQKEQIVSEELIS